MISRIFCNLTALKWHYMMEKLMFYIRLLLDIAYESWEMALKLFQTQLALTNYQRLNF